MLFRRARAAAAVGAIVLPAVVAPGCSCCGEPSDAGPAGESAGSAAGADSAGGAGEGGAGEAGAGGAGEPASSSSSATGGGGGAGGAGSAYRARGTETVTSGEVARSARFRMVFTLGQPTQNQGNTTSRHFRMEGGLVGANGSLP